MSEENIGKTLCLRINYAQENWDFRGNLLKETKKENSRLFEHKHIQVDLPFLFWALLKKMYAQVKVALSTGINRDLRIL